LVVREGKHPAYELRQHRYFLSVILFLLKPIIEVLQENTMNLAPLISASPAILMHLAAAVLALLFGTVMWMRPKGTKSHKLIGRAFMVLMLMTAVSAIFIRDINDGQFSFIHIFVIVTFVGIFQSLQAIKKRDIKKHVGHVKGLFFAALIIPGVLSFLPGRKLFMVFFGA